MAYEFEHDGETYLAEPDGGYVANGTPMDRYTIMKEVRSETGEVCYETHGSATVERKFKPTGFLTKHLFWKALRYSAFPEYRAEVDDEREEEDAMRRQGISW